MQEIATESSSRPAVEDTMPEHEPGPGPYPVLVAGCERLVLTPRRLRALGDLLDAQILIEDSERPPARPILATVQGEAIVWPVTCAPALEAALDQRERPACRWAPDAGGYRCQECGQHEPRLGDRGRVLAGLFGERPAPEDG